MKGKLILEDGSVFHGELLNNIKATGEVVFNTGMVGYQESLTDPSYCRQILTLTYPMVGNYGIADIFMQSRKSFVNGFVIGELCEEGSNWHYETSLADFLTKQGVPCLYNVDTRAVTRKIRSAGTMKGIIVADDAAKTEMDELFAVPIKKDVVMEVTTPETYTIEADKAEAPLVVAMDFGVKQNILKSLHELGCQIKVVPADTKAEDVLAMNPDGIFLSNGPGDPADVPEIVEEIKKLREEFWTNVCVPDTNEEFNQELEKALRLADFIEIGELIAKDALNRNESCGGHFRVEYQTPDGETKRDDENYMYVAAWEYKGENQEPELHKESLAYENIKIATRNYKD